MNESYGIEFKAITEKFKEKMRSLSNDIRNFGKEAEENTKITPSIDTGYEKQINYVKSQMQEIQYLLNRADAGEEIGKDTLKLEAEYETLSYKLEDLLEKQKEFNGELEETNKKSSRNGINLGEMFDKSISKIKRFTFYLLGARSVFSLFMKYQGIYYQYNEQLQYQSELSQNAIALSLAPAFEFLGNVIAYASIAFAKFIELLTGVNVLSKVSTKGIRDYNKGLKETQTLLSGIDEITNLTMPTGTGLASQYQALDEFRKKIAEVENFFKENKWIQAFVNGLKTVFDWISKAYNFIKDNWDVFKYIFGAVAIGTILLKIGTSVVGIGTTLGTMGTMFGLSGTAGTGVLGLATALKYLAGLGVISLVIALAIPGIKHDLEEIAEKGFKQFFTDTLNRVFEESLPEIFTNAYNLSVKWWLDPLIQKIKQDLQKIWQPVIDALKPVKEQVSNTFTSITDTMKNVTTDMWNNSFGPIFGRLENKVDTTKDDVIDALGDIKDEVKDTFKDENVDIKYNVTADTSKATNSLTSLFKKFNLGNILGAGVKAVSSVFSSLFSPHANGLDYVPYDNYPALLHKGEAVVPSKYNPTIHAMGNDYTNSLLETMILKLDDLSRRPNEFIVDGKKFASATYEYYQDEDSRQNYLKGVVAK